MKKTLLVGLAVVTLLYGGKAQAGLLNLHDIGAVATANSTYSVYDPSRAIDGTLGEESSWIATDRTDNWIQVNLGAQYLVDKISLFSRDTTSYPESFFINYELYAGNNGVDWGSKLALGTLYDNPDTDPTSNTDNDYYDHIVFNTPMMMQYIKVSIPSGTHWSHLSEIQVYGANGSNAPVPEPATILLFGTGLAGLAAVGRRKRK